MEKELEPFVITIKEAARLSALSIPTLYRMLSAGNLPTIKVGERRMVKYAEFKKMFEGDSIVVAKKIDVSKA